MRRAGLTIVISLLSCFGLAAGEVPEAGGNSSGGNAAQIVQSGGSTGSYHGTAGGGSWGSHGLSHQSYGGSWGTYRRHREVHRVRLFGASRGHWRERWQHASGCR